LDAATLAHQRADLQPSFTGVSNHRHSSIGP
jgi:hypothetical protein